MIGSIRRDLHLRKPSLVAALPAISKARTDESTSWKAPSTSVALMPRTGKPATTPFPRTDSIPFWTPAEPEWNHKGKNNENLKGTKPGMNSLGIEPPLISDTNSRSSPSFSSFGENSILTLAYWPEPPAIPRIKWRISQAVNHNSTWLFLVCIVNNSRLCNSLSVSNLWLTNITFYFKFSLHSVNNDF